MMQAFIDSVEVFSREALEELTRSVADRKAARAKLTTLYRRRKNELSAMAGAIGRGPWSPGEKMELLRLANHAFLSLDEINRKMRWGINVMQRKG